MIDLLVHTLYVAGGIFAIATLGVMVTLLILVNEAQDDHKGPPPELAKRLDADPREQMVMDPPVPPHCGREDIDINLFEQRRN